MTFASLITKYSKPMEPVPTGMPPRVNRRIRPAAVLFDVYGTLFISKAGDIGVAVEEARRNRSRIAAMFERYGISADPGEILDRFFAEITAEKEKMAGKGIEYPEVVIEKIWMRVLALDDVSMVRRIAVEYELIVNPVFPMPHMEELFDACHEEGVAMGIISNAQFYTPRLFSAYLKKPFREIGFDERLTFFSYRLGYGKPSLAVFEKAARRLRKDGVSVKDALYVGNDMLKDIYPASMTGFGTVLFAGDARSLNLREGDSRCRDVTPDLVVTDLAQIIELL